MWIAIIYDVDEDIGGIDEIRFGFPSELAVKQFVQRWKENGGYAEAHFAHPTCPLGHDSCER